MNGKNPNKIPYSKKPRKKKPKDKPKRPLSAYNYFFREEREKITKFLLNKDDTYGIETGLDPEHTRQLMTEKGKVKFEEVGKLIGKRWKTLSDTPKGEEEVKRYASLASSDAERYKKELREYNETKAKEEAAAAVAFPEGLHNDKRGRGHAKGGYGNSMYPGKKDQGYPRAPDGHYGGYPPSMYGGAPGGYYNPYPPAPGGSGHGSYPPPSNMHQGGQMGGYSSHYDPSYGHQPMGGYGSSPHGQYQTPPPMDQGGGYGGDPGPADHTSGFRPSSRGHGGAPSAQHPPPHSGYGEPPPSHAPPPPSYDDQGYAHGGQGGYSSQQPYPHYPPQGSYPPPSYGQSWGPPQN